MNSPAQVATNYISVAQSKTSMKWYKMLISAVLAGAFIAFGAAVATACSATLTGSWASLVKGAVFPVGLILVVICGAELFTGNCLLISPAIGGDIKITSLLKSWGIVYIGNFIGGILIAALVVFSGVQGNPETPGSIASVCLNTACNKATLNFGEAILRGILCNMLVCLAVWGAMASKTAAGKILAVYLPVLTFVACGFEHSVANMYYLFAGLFTGTKEGLNVGSALLNNLLPVTLGNIIGGCLIAIAYHAIYRGFAKKQPAAETAGKTEEAEKPASADEK